jgi:major membrane immunogen (membrane-anchored lipoprotein)
MRLALALGSALLLASCSSSDSDTDGDGKVSREERAAELASDGYLAMKPGRWKMQFAFNEIDVPRLGNKEKQDIIRELSSGASGVSCLSAAEANKPGADFFGGEGAEDCTYKRFDLAGEKARMTVSCGMGSMGKAEIELDGTVGDSAVDFDTKLILSIPLAGKVKLSGRLTGTHDGQCQGNE